MMRYPIALTIAGSDSSGGAGVQADIKTMSALGCYAASAITAVTVQNTMGVTAVHAVPPEVVAGQIKAVMDDINPTAVKVGMVNDTDTIHAIAHTIKPYLMEHGGGLRHLVVDPVMVATSGSRLMRDDALQCFCRELLPLATLLTPNVMEAEVLANMRLTSDDEMDKAALRILNLGCRALLIKGGHIEGEKKDRLYLSSQPDSPQFFVAENIATRNTHGTGCTLSSAITAWLAQGEEMTAAIGKAKHYLTAALRAGAGVEIGQGHGPVNHFYQPLSLRATNK